MGDLDQLAAALHGKMIRSSDPAYDEARKVHNGAIGEIRAMQCTYNAQTPWEPRRTREQCQSDMEYQLRNWYFYTWLSGDFNVEQHVHSLDKMAWVMKDETPVSVSGTGGRQQRNRLSFLVGDFLLLQHRLGVENIFFCRFQHGVKAAEYTHWQDDIGIFAAFE